MLHQNIMQSEIEPGAKACRHFIGIDIGYSARHHKLPKTTYPEFSFITLVQRNIKPPNLEQVFCTHCCHTESLFTQKI